MNINRAKKIIEKVGSYVMDRYGSIAINYDPKEFVAGRRLRIYFNFSDPNSKKLTDINDYAGVYEGCLYPGNVKNNNQFTALLSFP